MTAPASNQQTWADPMAMIAAFLRLAAMRRRAGASHLTALRWASGLLWRDLCTSFVTISQRVANAPDQHRRERLDRRADVERRARQRL